MKIARQFHSLEQATSRDFMITLFTKYLDRIVPGSLRTIDLQIPRLFAQPDDSFVIQYDLTVGLAGAASEKKILVGGLLNGVGDSPSGSITADENVIQCDELPLCLMVFPHDPSLPGLSLLAKGHKLPIRIASAIKGHLGSDFSIPVSEITPLGWRPGRRAVVKISIVCDPADDSGQTSREFIIKLVRPTKAARLFDRMDKLAQWLATSEACNNFVIPRILASDRDSGMIVMPLIDGSSLHQLIGADQFVSGCAQAGRLLSSLHSLKAISLPDHIWAKELESTRLACERTSRIFPDLARLINNRLDELGQAGDMMLELSEPTVIHRDFYDKQILPGDIRPALLDLDILSRGDPAQDIGNFLAHLELRGVQYPQWKNLINSGATVFLAGYGNWANEFQFKIEQWKKIALVRLTCLYLLRPKWRELAPNLLRADQSEPKRDFQPRGKT